MPPTDPEPGPAGPVRPVELPAPLRVAAAVVAVEAFLLVALGVLELAALDGDRIGLGLSTAGFFLAAGAGLATCAYALWRGRRWGRGPVLLAQLIMLGLAWNLRGGGTTAVAVGLAVAAVVVFAGLLHPSSVDVLEDRER